MKLSLFFGIFLIISFSVYSIFYISNNLKITGNVIEQAGDGGISELSTYKQGEIVDYVWANGQLFARVVELQDLEVDVSVAQASTFLDLSSIIVNNEENEISGILKMILQKNEDGEWIDVEIVVNKEISVPAGNSIELNEVWNSVEITAQSAGDYRIYAEFILKDGQMFSSLKEFEVK